MSKKQIEKKGTNRLLSFAHVRPSSIDEDQKPLVRDLAVCEQEGLSAAARESLELHSCLLYVAALLQLLQLF